MALEDSRYCYSPTTESNNSPALPNSPSSFSRNSSTASSPTTVCDIKMSSKHGIAVDDEDMDINVDDDEEEDFKTTTKSSGGQLNIGKFSFSITNILSDTFGPKSVKTEHPEPHSDMKLFRPFEMKNFIANNAAAAVNNNRQAASFVQNFNPSSVFLNSFRLSEIFNDYSTKANINVDNKASDNSLRHSIYNTFSAYPKIHEEILNHKAAKLSSAPATNSQISPSSTTIGKITSSSTSHALGGLCKTISQIGQENCLSPPQSVASSNKSYNSEKFQQSSTESTIDSDDCQSEASINTKDDNKMWPAWIFCTRYSDRPSSGPRYRRPKEKKEKNVDDEKRPRTAFSNDQLQRLKREFIENRYLTEKRRQALSAELGLNEAQIKIWFQNKRAKIKKSSGVKNALAIQLMAQGLYNHTTVPLTKEEEELELRMNGKLP